MYFIRILILNKRQLRRNSSLVWIAHFSPLFMYECVLCSYTVHSYFRFWKKNLCAVFRTQTKIQWFSYFWRFSIIFLCIFLSSAKLIRITSSTFLSSLFGLWLEISGLQAQNKAMTMNQISQNTRTTKKVDEMNRSHTKFWYFLSNRSVTTFFKASFWK